VLSFVGLSLKDPTSEGGVRNGSALLVHISSMNCTFHGSN
jgi:hypothetical protein